MIDASGREVHPHDEVFLTLRKGSVADQLSAISFLEHCLADAQYALPALAQAAYNGVDEIAESCVQAIAAFGEEAIPYLFDFLHSDSPLLLRSAALASRRLGHPATSFLDLFRKMLLHSDEGVQDSAVLAIAFLASHGSEAIEDLISLWKRNPSRVVLAHVVMAFGALGSAAHAAVPLLMEVVRNRGDDFLRELAEDAIEEITPDGIGF